MECKLGLKVTVKSLGSLLVLLVLAIAGGAAAGYLLQQSQIFQKIEVGIVIPEEEETSKLIAQFLSSMDSVRSVCDLVYLDQEEAQEQMLNGRLQAVIYLPENFYQDMDSGVNTPAVICFPSQTKLNTRIFRELLMDGVSLVQTTEAGVYASLDAAKFRDTKMEWKEVGDYIFMIYLEQAFERGEIFQEVVYSPFGEVDLYQYYLSSIIVVFLLFSGLNYGFLYQKKGNATEEKLSVYGIGAGKRSLVKIIVMSGILWILSALVYLLLCAVNLLFDNPLIWLDGSVFLLLAPFCLGIASYFHLIYALAGGSNHGAVCLLAANAVMMLCSGTVIPTAYLSRGLQTLGSCFPMGIWSQYEAGILFHSLQGSDLVNILLISVLTGGIGTLLLWKNTGFGTRCS
ncbi:MAG: ABC transporter permease [Eubacterium sp.]|nr:ABC transporter permease [Eubacterium sp.]